MEFFAVAGNNVIAYKYFTRSSLKQVEREKGRKIDREKERER